MTYNIFKFKTRGLGVVCGDTIKEGTYIGNYFEKNIVSNEVSRHIYNRWFETPFFGRYLNHNNLPNCKLELSTDSIKIIANKDINVNEEITVNYLDVIDILNLPKEEVLKHGIQNFEYIEEPIDLFSKQAI